METPDIWGESEGMLNSVPWYTEFLGKRRTSRRKFLIGIWKFGIQVADLGAIGIHVNTGRVEMLSEVVTDGALRVAQFKLSLHVWGPQFCSWCLHKKKNNPKTKQTKNILQTPTFHGSLTGSLTTLLVFECRPWFGLEPSGKNYSNLNADSLPPREAASSCLLVWYPGWVWVMALLVQMWLHLCPQVRVVLLKRRWGAWTGGGRDTSLPVWYGLETINPFVLTRKPRFSSILILYSVPVGSHPSCLILDCKVSFGCRDSWTCNQLISSHLLSRNSSSKKIRELTLK